MPLTLSRQMLDSLIGGTDLAESDIRGLVETSPEDLYLDFKNGLELNDSKNAARTVRRYVSAFANADGGFLVLGVSDGKPGTRTFTTIPLPGASTLAEWATRVLAPLASYLSPAPRIQEASVGGCNVLLVAVARAPSLVPCYEDGELCYYLRLGDSTLLVPHYLLSDLLLGRRSHPTLALEPGHVGPAINGAGELGRCLVAFRFHVDNVGMVPADDVVVGVTSWGYQPRDAAQGRLAPEHLRSFVDLSPAPAAGASAEGMALVHATSRVRGETVDLPGFDIGQSLVVGSFLIPREDVPIPVRSAAYVLAKGHPPEWYQFDWWAPPQTGTAPFDVRLTRTFAARPVVAWNAAWT